MSSYKIIYEDNDCAVINKPSGVLVHSVPGENNADTISKWWAGYDGVVKSGWADSSRIGIVHRLDKDTSGALLLAKSPVALEYYQRQFKKRNITKKYIAIVFGTPKPTEGKIVSYIARDSKNRTHRQSQLISFGTERTKTAVSLYKILKTANLLKTEISVVEFNIKTGRTHQIRAHAKMIGCPILGDDHYFIKPSRRISSKLGIHRQLLHARTLCFKNMTGELININVPIPEDMERYV